MLDVFETGSSGFSSCGGWFIHSCEFLMWDKLIIYITQAYGRLFLAANILRSIYHDCKMLDFKTVDAMERTVMMMMMMMMNECTLTWRKS